VAEVAARLGMSTHSLCVWVKRYSKPQEQRAYKEGYLAGQVNLRVISEQLFGYQRLARQDWVNGFIDLAAYRRRLLQGMLLVLAADAVPAFHLRLLERLEKM
jgi:ribosome modulation factor